MRNVISFFIVIELLALSACGSTNVSGQMPKHLSITKTQTVELNYLLFLPRGYEPSGKRWPLILFLHGAGERGSDIQKVATHGPPKKVKNDPDFPFIVVSPQCPEREHWSNDSLLLLLEEVLNKYSVDTNRVYLTGLSMGGYGTWSLALAYPEKFAAIVPICGGGQMIAILLSGRDKAE